MEGLNFQGPSAASACEGLKHMQEEASRAGLEVAPLKVGWYNQVCSLTSRLTSLCEENRETGKGGWAKWVWVSFYLSCSGSNASRG